jgi:hypothetical protein
MFDACVLPRPIASYVLVAGMMCVTFLLSPGRSVSETAAART